MRRCTSSGMLWMPSTSSALTKFVSRGEAFLDVAERFLEVVEARIAGVAIGADVGEILFRQHQLRGLARRESKHLSEVLGVRRGDLSLDADGLAVVVDAFDLMLRERLANGNGRGQPQIDEHFRARRIVVQAIGEPLVKLADPADDALEEVVRAHG